MWCVIASNPWNNPIIYILPSGSFQLILNSELRPEVCSSREQSQAFIGMVLLSYPWTRGSISAFPCLVWLSIKDKSETKTVCSKEQKSLQSPLPLFRAIQIGFCYCTAVAAHYPGILAGGNDRFCGDLTAAVASGPFPGVQPKQKPVVDQPLWWPDSHRRVRAIERTASEVTW